MLAPMADAPEVGRWLSALQDGRLDTLAGLSDLPDDVLDRQPPECDNSIGTVLYHVALIEADWLFDDIFGIDLADSELAEQFALADRDSDGLLISIRGESLAMHLQRLATVRNLVIERLRSLSVQEFHAPRTRERYDVSPAWVIHHLLQHESEHRAEIGWIRRLVCDTGT